MSTSFLTFSDLSPLLPLNHVPISRCIARNRGFSPNFAVCKEFVNALKLYPLRVEITQLSKDIRTFAQFFARTCAAFLPVADR